MAAYPLPAFHFSIEWGGANLGFSEVSGLSYETEVIEYRDGISPKYSKIKMPGMVKYSNITLKRGIVPADNEFFAWVSKNVMNTADRRTIIINLLDEKGDPVMTWKVENAFPVKVEGPGLKADGNEIAIESIELAHEGLVVENG